jgi:hypothetical protein
LATHTTRITRAYKHYAAALERYFLSVYGLPVKVDTPRVSYLPPYLFEVGGWSVRASGDEIVECLMEAEARIEIKLADDEPLNVTDMPTGIFARFQPKFTLLTTA